jgi:uncharacterized heparinase superfamily protein
VEIAPGDARSIDPAFCDELKSGSLACAGVSVPLGTSLFDVRAPSPAWSTALHGFSWLRHVAGAGDGEAARLSRQIVLDWIERRAELPAIAFNGEVIARRALSWLASADMLLDTATAAEIEAFGTAWGRDVARLRQISAEGLEAGALEAAYVQTMIAWCTESAPEDRHALDLALIRQIEAAVTPDGFHLSRDPARTLALLLDLRAVKLVHQLRLSSMAEPLDAAIQRLSAALAFLRLGDGTLAFAGTPSVSEGQRPPVNVPMRPVQSSGALLKAGYVRLAAGPLTLLADCGPPASRPWAGGASATTLAFACSSGNAPLLGGAPGRSDRIEDRTALLANTVLIADTSSGRFEPVDGGGHDLVFDGSVTADVGSTDGSPWLEATHTGYRDRFGVVHRRRIELSVDGSAITGTDVLLAPDEAAPGATIRAAAGFIPARGTALGLTDDPAAIDIHIANGERWRLTSADGPISVEPVGEAGSASANPAMRLILPFASGMARQVRWRLERLSQAAPHATAPTPAGEDVPAGPPASRQVSQPRPLSTLREALARVTGRSSGD